MNIKASSLKTTENHAAKEQSGPPNVSEMRKFAWWRRLVCNVVLVVVCSYTRHPPHVEKVSAYTMGPLNAEKVVVASCIRGPPHSEKLSAYTKHPPHAEKSVVTSYVKSPLHTEEVSTYTACPPYAFSNSMRGFISVSVLL